MRTRVLMEQPPENTSFAEQVLAFFALHRILDKIVADWATKILFSVSCLGVSYTM